jgi:hydrogenase expression/formation protein HypC
VCLAVPRRIVDVQEREGAALAQVDAGGVPVEVCLAFVPEAQVGDWVLVHLGMALRRLPEQEALEHLRLLGEAVRATEPETSGGKATS